MCPTAKTPTQCVLLCHAQMNRTVSEKLWLKLVTELYDKNKVLFVYLQCSLYVKSHTIKETQFG